MKRMHAHGAAHGVLLMRVRLAARAPILIVSIATTKAKLSGI